MSDSKEVFTPVIDAATATTQEMFGQILQKRIQEGALEVAITKNVDSLIDEVARDVFRSYGDVGKALKDQMTKALAPCMDDLDDLPSYSDFVTNRLKIAAQNFHDQRLAKVIDAELKEVLSEIPEEIKLSWLVKKVVESACDDEYSEGEITLIIEVPGWSTGDKTVLVHMDKESDKDRYDCGYKLHLSKDKDAGKYEILSLEVNDRKTASGVTLGRMYGADKVLFNVYAMKGLIDIDLGLDADDYEYSWSNYD